MAKSSKVGESDFVLRTTDILASSEHRRLEVIDQKKIKEIIENLEVLSDEAVAMEGLKDAQRQEYNVLLSEIKNCIGVLSNNISIDNVADEILMDIKNMERKKHSAESKSLDDEKEALPEPE